MINYAPLKLLRNPYVCIVDIHHLSLHNNPLDNSLCTHHYPYTQNKAT